MTEDAMFPIPVTVTPIEIAPCSQCCDRIKFNFICARPPRFGRSDNVITDNCVDCVVLSQNGDSGSFIPTMMESADIICDDVLGNYYNGTVNNVITTFACT